MSAEIKYFKGHLDYNLDQLMEDLWDSDSKSNICEMILTVLHRFLFYSIDIYDSYSKSISKLIGQIKKIVIYNWLESKY